MEKTTLSDLHVSYTHSPHQISPTMAQTPRLINMASVKSIMNRRVLIVNSMIGKRVRMFIQGDGTVLDAKHKDGSYVLSTVAGQEGTVLQKRIFNLQANAQAAMTTPLNREALKRGIDAEKAGDMEKAHEAYNEYLNRCQLTFGILLPNPTADKLGHGVEIAATIQQVTTDNGSLLTIDPSTISIVEPEVAGSTVFNVDDIFNMGDDTTNEDEAAAEAAKLTMATLDKKAKSKWTAADKTAYAEAQAVLGVKA